MKTLILHYQEWMKEMTQIAEKSTRAWERRMETWRAKYPAAAAALDSADVVMAEAPRVESPVDAPSDKAAVPADEASKDGEDKPTKEDAGKPPNKKFLWTPSARQLLVNVISSDLDLTKLLARFKEVARISYPLERTFPPAEEDAVAFKLYLGHISAAYGGESQLKLMFDHLCIVMKPIWDLTAGDFKRQWTLMNKPKEQKEKKATPPILSPILELQAAPPPPSAQ
jgi:hypothetical protein